MYRPTTIPDRLYFNKLGVIQHINEEIAYFLGHRVYVEPLIVQFFQCYGLKPSVGLLILRVVGLQYWNETISNLLE